MNEERSLSELVHELKQQNEKIRFLLGEVVNEYFRRYDEDINSTEILMYFGQNRIQAEIAWDYIIKNTCDLKDLERFI